VVVFRTDAAFAKPEITATLEERGMKDAIRIPNDDDFVPGMAGFANAACGST